MDVVVSPPPAQPKIRRSRSVPSPVDVNFRITERDAAIVHAVYSHRFLRTDHIFALISLRYGGSYQKISERLRLLFDAGYLARVTAKGAEYVPGGGSQREVYQLNSEAPQLLEYWYGVPRNRVHWRRKRKPDRIGHDARLHHELYASHIMTSIEVACLQTKGIRFISSTEILENSTPDVQESTTPFAWRVRVEGWPRKLPCMPDGIFGLEIKDRRTYFILEADTGTMSIERRDKFQSSVFRHMTAYYHWYRQGGHKTMFNWHNFRVLIATDVQQPQKRFETMLEANRKLTPNGKGTGMFLFQNQDALVPDSLLDRDNKIVSCKTLRSLWINGRGKEDTLAG